MFPAICQTLFGQHKGEVRVAAADCLKVWIIHSFFIQSIFFLILFYFFFYMYIIRRYKIVARWVKGFGLGSTKQNSKKSSRDLPHHSFILFFLQYTHYVLFFFFYDRITLIKIFECYITAVVPVHSISVLFI